MAGRHRIPGQGETDKDRGQWILLLILLGMAGAAVVLAGFLGKDFWAYVSMGITSACLFITAIPKRNRPALWLAGASLVWESLEVLQTSHLHVWNGSQLKDLTNIATWLTIVPLTWYAVSRTDGSAPDWYRRIRSRFQPSQPQPPTPLDDL